MTDTWKRVDGPYRGPPLTGDPVLTGSTLVGPLTKGDTRLIRMQAALLAAAEQFALYADYHLAKEPPDREKAAVNVEWAARCREAAYVR